MDKITIENLEVFAYHGVLAEENALGQKFLISVTMELDTWRAGTSDDLNASVNYSLVCHEITKWMQQEQIQLIERVAEMIAERLLDTFSLIKRVKVTVKKPWAPIMLPLETVAVTIVRGWHTVYLSIGSNIGDKKAHLDFAIEQLEQHKKIRNVKATSYYETEPYGFTEQDLFLNACLELETMMEPEELLSELQRIELQDGRTRDIHWGPRTLDLDILFYDRILYHSENLLIPHPEIAKRMFVLEPMCELAQWFVHPVYQKTMEELLEERKNKDRENDDDRLN